ncbi:sensor histidine kinase [Stenotrophomonas acidaminiphila]
MDLPPQTHASASSPELLRPPLEALWQTSTLVFIVLAGELLAVILALAPGIDGSRWVHFGLTSLLIQWTSLLTVSVLALLRRPLEKLRPLSVAYFALATLLVVTSIICSILWLLLHDQLILQPAAWRVLWLQFSGIALAVGLIGLAIFRSHWNARQMAVRIKQAELDALQARIHPHFLFNTLNTGVALVHQQPEKAEQLLLDLADLFRAALAGPNRIPLREEIELARRYAEIEHLRFGQRMRLEWELPEPLPTLQVPTLSIQPLVENAIHHGVEPSTTSCLLRVTVDQQADRARIVVINDLPASPASARPGHGVGLRAVRERVRAMGGQVETRSEGNCYVATMTMPCRPEQATAPSGAQGVNP